MSSVFHHQSLVHTTLVKSCSCSSSQGVVCFVATDSCCFAEMSNSFAESVMSEWFVGIPAGWCWALGWLQVESMCWLTTWTQLNIPLKQPHKTSLRVCQISMMGNNLGLHISSPYPPGQFLEMSSVYLRNALSPGCSTSCIWQGIDLSC